MNETNISAGRQPRYDIYAAIHKAMRMFMCDTLLAAGNMDSSDPQNVAEVLAQVRDLASACLAHLRHENHFVHSAMEERRPGSASRIAEEHEHHLAALETILDLAADVEAAQGQARAAAAMRLYRYLSVFVGENLVHMNVEETEHNEVLWATHTDEELLGIEHAIVSSQQPVESLSTMRWMIPAIAPQERAELLSGMRRNAPPPVFDAVLGVARTHLPAKDWHQLLDALALPGGTERAAA